jgi:hypothetical protein
VVALPVTIVRVRHVADNPRGAVVLVDAANGAFVLRQLEERVGAVDREPLFDLADPLDLNVLRGVELAQGGVDLARSFVVPLEVLGEPNLLWRVDLSRS